MRHTTKTLAASELVEDLTIYPRHAVDAMHVTALVEALESGATLPPITADAKSRRVTDGWHRLRAHIRHSGPDAPVEVELVEYPDETAMLMDAVARNSQHGRRLDRVDRCRSALMLRSVGVPVDKIAVVLQTTEVSVNRLIVRVATAPKSASTTAPGTTSMPLKPCARHFEGRRMTKEQADAHVSMPGTTLALSARQLTMALETGIADLTDERLVECLRKLRSAIDVALP